MHDQADLARGWIQKGDSDLSTGDERAAGEGPFDTACFHAQLASEKYLKALIAFSGAAIPKTHGLEVLATACTRLYPALDLGELDLSRRTPFAVQLRYDHEFWPDRGEAEQSLEIARKARAIIVKHLPPKAHPGN